jgi:hypothetical protein
MSFVRHDPSQYINTPRSPALRHFLVSLASRTSQSSLQKRRTISRRLGEEPQQSVAGAETSYRVAMDRSREDSMSKDRPITPPQHVTDATPAWQYCGKVSCGDHHHPLSKIESDGDASPVPFSRHFMSCDICTEERSSLEMHLLTCGHALCRGCLSLAANRIRLQMHEQQEEIDNNLRLADNLTRQADILRPRDRDYAAFLDRTSREFQLRAWDHAGFMCCGQLAGLERYIHCLEVKVAKSFWLDVQLLLTKVTDRFFCGWPDCHEFIPRVCAYNRESETRWYCVQCGANSQASTTDSLSLVPIPAR